jgi:hypothetical protein
MPDPPPVPRETRPCVTCKQPIEPGAAYSITARGPEHVRHRRPLGDDRPHVDLYPPDRPETFPGGP